jgi:NIPSNAP protein
MRSKLFVALSLVLVGLAAFAAGYSTGQDSKANTRAYELRTYTTLPGRLPALNKRFAEHTLKLFEKHGMRNEMYFIPSERAVGQQVTPVENTLVYLVSHDNREAADRSWKGFGADPEWKTARDASEADGKIVEKVERVWMKLTDYSPRK